MEIRSPGPESPSAGDGDIDLRDHRSAGPGSGAGRSIATRSATTNLGERIAVRALDLGVAVPTLAMLSPLMVLIGLAIKLDSPGPIFYRSVRVGRRNQTFHAWKFRSMTPDAEAELPALLTANPELAAEYQTYHKLREDPRLTRVGRLIRRTSLDELPQLLNIVIGEMSLVGPRPNLIGESQVFGSSLEELLRVRPGLTGLWQISGRSRLSLADRVALDLRYVRSRTIGSDLRICMTTARQLCRPGRHGAF